MVINTKLLFAFILNFSALYSIINYNILNLVFNAEEVCEERDECIYT
jgi:hypothetical protein